MRPIISTFLLLMIFVSCSEDSKYEDISQSLEAGAYLRVVDVQALNIDSDTPYEPIFELNLEAVTSLVGPQISLVDIYVTHLSSISADNEERVLLQTIPINQFDTQSNSGLPRYAYDVNLAGILAALRFQSYSEFKRDDVLRFEWVAHLTNGGTFSAENSGVSVKSQSFYNSPFIIDVLMDCNPINEDFAIGSYHLENGLQLLNCTWFGLCHYFEDGVIEIRRGDLEYERVFTVAYFHNEVEFKFILECDKITVPYQKVNLGCQDNPIAWKTLDNEINLIDFSNDDSFEFKFFHDFDNACELNEDVSFILTRQ